MLTITDVPQSILDLYRESKIPATVIMNSISARFPQLDIDSHVDLCKTYPGTMIAVRNGIFKYFISDKFVRFYSTGDIISIPDTPDCGFSISNEFGAGICCVPKIEFLTLVTENPALLGAWFTYQRASDIIMHVLCSIYIKEEFDPHSEIRQYQAGETIIKEGDGPDYLFELLEGSASVTARGTEIGMVKEGEVFGEVSFLTGTPRGATVTATASCLVQAIKRPDLEKFSKHRPGLIYKLSQTLAYRLNEVNKRLVSISSLT